MNRTWAREKLETFAGLVESALSDGGSDERLKELRRRESTVKRILRELEPNSGLFSIEFSAQYPGVVGDIQRALGLLDDLDELAENLAPQGPQLRADRFHPWVWESGQTFWASSHYRAAVEAAAKAINAHTQTKVGRRDISDNDLMNQVFTEKPRAGQKYLRIPGDPNDVMIRNRNRALRPFAEGCFAGIRNLAAHEHQDDWDEQPALECLAALSILARWIDECDVVTAEPATSAAAS